MRPPTCVKWQCKSKKRFSAEPKSQPRKKESGQKCPDFFERGAGCRGATYLRLLVDLHNFRAGILCIFLFDIILNVWYIIITERGK